MPKVLESEKKLSESILWQFQKVAYQKFGPSAWSNKGVPFYLTSTPMIAHQYASVVLGFVRDLLKQNLDPSQPLYLFDLGAGTGRFSYLFLKHFLGMLKQLFPSFPCKICYVMTDIVPENIEFWQNHPLLQSYINAHVLDFAAYQHDQKVPLELILSRQVLSEETVKNPAVLIANYFFDTVPQDLYRVSEGQLEEGRVTVSLGDETISLDKIDPDWVKDLELSYTFFPIESTSSSFLGEYAKKITEGVFTFPVGGFQALDYFSKISPKGFLLICCDQGLASASQVKESKRLKISLHDTFSFPVNYHFLSEYFNMCGGKAWLTSLSDPAFVVMAGVWEGSCDQYLETAFAFKNTLDAFEPKDYWHLVNGITGNEFSLPIESLVAYLKLGRWDPVNAYFLQDAIIKQIPTASDHVKQMLAQVIDCIWEEYYPVNLSERVFVANLGRMMFSLGRLKDAILFYERANKLPQFISVANDLS